LQKTGCQPLPDTNLGENAKNGSVIDILMAGRNGEYAF